MEPFLRHYAVHFAGKRPERERHARVHLPERLCEVARQLRRRRRRLSPPTTWAPPKVPGSSFARAECRSSARYLRGSIDSRVADDADDVQKASGRRRPHAAHIAENLASNGILVFEVHPAERLVDDDDIGRTWAIARP